MPTLSALLFPFANTPTPSLSDRVVRALEAYVAAEGRELTASQSIVNQAKDPVLRLLVGMIVEDQKRHQMLLQLLINRLHEDLDFVPSPMALPVPTDSSDPKTASVFRALLRDKHEDARHIRQLARRDETLYGGLYSLLLETLARDAEKHASILQYLSGRLEPVKV